ncbi:hypothetical protein SAMN05660235_01051 [Sporolituus thermophilus DSM 23256]|uniref:Uncharacterized protein n=1 Tax=Sporolituus thermophilus DSM 23256 TaxID=1123285 RepID=A0A1G7JTV2_9FIRM|nr:hypothetical protein SAMN05660235_01051 [Sporolituus thermophilus DSM 23256]
MGKVFVQITAEHNLNGEIRPLTLRWINGRVYPIDRILDIDICRLHRLDRKFWH